MRWDEKGSVTTNTNGIQRIIREYLGKFYSNKLENLEEIDNFLDTYYLPKLNQENINTLNRFIVSNEIEISNRVSQQSQLQDQMEPLLNSLRSLKKDQPQCSSNYSKK
jgi:hypothetical protein